MLINFLKNKFRLNEICNECGKNVNISTGLFINRVADLNDKKTRIKMGKSFPNGDFICIDCDNKISQKVPTDFL